MWRAASVFAFVLVAYAAPVLAQEPSLTQAERLLMADDPAAARQAAALPAQVDDEEETRRQWVLALSHMRENAPRAALPHLEWLVSQSPETPRFRLELARALYLIEEDERAQHHFQFALGGELSLTEIAAVNDYLRAMEKRKPWQGHARIAAVTQTNPFHRSGEDYVSIGGLLLLPLPPVERARGVEVGLGGTYLPRLAPDLHARAHVMVTGQLFEESDLNRWHLRSEFGLLSLGDHGQQISGGVTVQGAFGAQGRIMHGVGLYAGFQRRFGNRTSVAMRVTADQLTYRNAPSLDGPRVTASLEASRVLSPRLRVQGGLSFMHHHTQAEHNRRSTATARLGGEYAFRGGIQTGLEAQLSQSRLKAANPLLFQYGPEKSTRLGLTAQLMHRDFRIRGFAPVLTAGYETQSSNVPMQAYNNLKFSVGATRSF